MLQSVTRLLRTILFRVQIRYKIHKLIKVNIKLNFLCYCFCTKIRGERSDSDPTYPRPALKNKIQKRMNTATTFLGSNREPNIPYKQVKTDPITRLSSFYNLTFHINKKCNKFC